MILTGPLTQIHFCNNLAFDIPSTMLLSYLSSLTRRRLIISGNVSAYNLLLALNKLRFLQIHGELHGKLYLYDVWRAICGIRRAA